MSRSVFCHNCKYFDLRYHEEQATNYGSCRINPPVRLEQGSRGAWPTVSKWDWCGELRRADPLSALENEL